MKDIFSIDINAVFDKAKAMTEAANSSKQYKAAAREWLKLKFTDDPEYFYFQDKVDWCLEMAEACKGIERIK